MLEYVGDETSKTVHLTRALCGRFRSDRGIGAVCTQRISYLYSERSPERSRTSTNTDNGPKSYALARDLSRAAISTPSMHNSRSSDICRRRSISANVRHISTSIDGTGSRRRIFYRRRAAMARSSSGVARPDAYVADHTTSQTHRAPRSAHRSCLNTSKPHPARRRDYLRPPFPCDPTIPLWAREGSPNPITRPDGVRTMRRRVRRGA